MANALTQIRGDLENYVGSRIRLKANRGRRKTIIREGVLEKTYPHVFTVKLDDDKSSIPRVSYSYADILTEAVELTVLTNNSKIKISYDAKKKR